MRAWLDTLGVVAQIAFRNLFASRLKTIIVGGIIFFGAPAGRRGQLAARQRRRVDEPQRHRQRRRPHPGLQRRVQGHAGGHGADDDGRPAIWRSSTTSPRCARRCSRCPTSSRSCRWASAARWSPSGNTIDLALEKLRKPSRRRAQGQDRRRARATLDAQVASREGPRPPDRARCCRATSRTPRRCCDATRHRPGGRRRRSRAPRPTRSGPTSTRIRSTRWSSSRTGSRRQAADADLLFLRYVGTDFEAFEKSFDRMKIVDGDARSRRASAASCSPSSSTRSS